MGWLQGWAKRVKITLDQNDIDEALSDFPVLLYLSTASGINAEDISFIFDEVGANSKKIAVTKSDGTTQCYVEIEKWDLGNEKAWLWVKVPSIISTVDTYLYLYYDSTQADNTTYVGDPNSTPAENVWDANFGLVCHMRDDPDTSSVRDSTSNSNDGAKLGAGAPAVTADGKIDDAQDFDGIDDYIEFGTDPSILITGANPRTVEAEVKYEGDSGDIIGWGTDATCRQFALKFEGGKLYAWGYACDKAGATTLTSGVKYHVGLVYTGTTRILYLNGISDGSDTPTLNTGTVNSVEVGRESGGGNVLAAIIDEVRISDVARPAAWMKATYETGRDHLIDWGTEETPYVVSGVTRDSGGSILGSCTVWLFKTSDKSYLYETTSDPSTGEYTFQVEDNTTEHFIRAKKDGTPNVFGTTDDALVGVS